MGWENGVTRMELNFGDLVGFISVTVPILIPLRYKPPAPDVTKVSLIKIDVQGSEIDVIEGGKDIIRNSNFLIIEMSLQNYNEGAPKLLEVINNLNKNNFELIDIIDRNYRNNILVQIDGIFRNKDKDIINFTKLMK